MVVLTQEAALLSQSADSYPLQTSTHFPLPSWHLFPTWTGMHMGRGAWAPILSGLLHLIDGHQAVEARFEPWAAANVAM